MTLVSRRCFVDAHQDVVLAVVVVTLLRLLDNALPQTRLNCLLDEAGDLVLQRPASHQVGAESTIGVIGSNDGPMNVTCC